MSENKRYYWLKLKQNFFREKEVKKLRKIAGGDTYTIIYLKLLLLSTESDGKLYFDGIEDTFYEELALEIDEEPENVKITIMFLMKSKLIKEIKTDEMEFSRIDELIGSETNKAEIMRRNRSKKRIEEDKKVTLLPDVTQTLPYIELELELEKELELELERRAKDKEIEKEFEKGKGKKETNAIGNDNFVENNVENNVERTERLRREFLLNAKTATE